MITNNQLSFIVFLIILMSIAPSCFFNDDDGDSVYNVPTEIMSGTVVIPEDATISTEGLHIHSAVDVSSIENGIFSINTLSGMFTSHFVVNQSNEVLLLDYIYPGYSDPVVDINSTALALIMNNPTAYELDNQGRLNLIEEVKSNEKFIDVVQNVKIVLAEGKSVLDTSNLDLATSVNLLFDDITEARITEVDPVLYNRAGRNVSIVNYGRKHYTAIGIYRNNERIVSELLKPIDNVAPNSIGQLVGAVIDLLPFDQNDPNIFIDTRSIDLEGDGIFHVVIRTGKPGHIDPTDENLEAAWANIKYSALQIIITALPPIEDALGCVGSFLDFKKSEILTSYNAADIITIGQFIAFIMDVVELTIVDVLDFSIDCGLVVLKKGYAVLFERLVSYLSLVSTLGNAANLSVTGAHILNSTPAIDYYFEINGESIIDYLLDNRDGQIYNIVQIGNQIWMAENLNYNVSGSSCYDEESANCDIYGRLYGHGPTAIDACPEGWHLPSREEFIELANTLGGIDNAGGKMKTLGTKQAGDGLWNEPNLGADNSSGFSAVPAGARLYTPSYPTPVISYRNLGDVATFWTSTRGPDGYGVFNIYHDRELIWYNSAFTSGYFRFSVRCVKD